MTVKRPSKAGRNRVGFSLTDATIALLRVRAGWAFPSQLATASLKRIDPTTRRGDAARRHGQTTEETESPPAAEKTQRHTTGRTRRWHHLHDFVVGPCNRVAHASAVSAVEAPDQGPNPLVLHGPVGTGKTHLLEGIYAGLRKREPEWRVVFATAEEFTNRFLPAMRLGKLAGFRKYFRECDALLIDDLHFLAGKRATQEELLHTIDALHPAGRPVV